MFMFDEHKGFIDLQPLFGLQQGMAKLTFSTIVIVVGKVTKDTDSNR
jgi:hypothetical protein